MAKDNDDGLDIPAFLRRQKDGSFANPKARAKGKKRPAEKPPQPVEPGPIEQIASPDFKAYVEAEVKSGRVNEKWLNDPSTLSLLEAEYYGKRQRREEGLEKLRALGEARRAEKALQPPKPVYGEGVYLVEVAPVNPRKTGTGAWKRYNKLLEYIKDHPQPTVAEVIAHAGYRKDDLEWDLTKTKAVKTDVHRKAVEPVPPKRKKA